MGSKVNYPSSVRPLHSIAREILGDVNLKGNTRVYAEAYLRPMLSLETINDSYGADDGETIARYAVSNLAHYRGPLARRLKIELRAHYERPQTPILPSPWIISDPSSVVLARFASEAERDGALLTGDYPDDAEPAYIS